MFPNIRQLKKAKIGFIRKSGVGEKRNFKTIC